jgi:NAD(P)-dependent dehydrogenase (short-subunit alcohol dehydrogenase family)
VANAVVDDHAPLGKITEEQFDKMIGTNLKGVLFAVQSAVPLMSSGGSIILIGSTASVAPPAGMSIYSAIKAAFRGIHEARGFDEGKVAAVAPTSAMICGAESTPSPGTPASRCTASWWAVSRSAIC